MLQVDDRLWPLGIFIAEGLQTLPRHMQMLESWDAWLKRGEPFVALRIYRDEASLDHVEGVAKATKEWLRGGADTLLRAHVAAMINVVPPSAYERMKHMSVEAVFGVPGGIFADAASALDWFFANVALKGSPEITSQRLEMHLSELLHTGRRPADT
jgi:hypothetical protein